MELSGFLVWHYYDKNGKLIRWGTTHFEKTTERQLADLLKEDSKESDKKREKRDQSCIRLFLSLKIRKNPKNQNVFSAFPRRRSFFRA